MFWPGRFTHSYSFLFLFVLNLIICYFITSSYIIYVTNIFKNLVSQDAISYGGENQFAITKKHYHNEVHSEENT